MAGTQREPEFQQVLEAVMGDHLQAFLNDQSRRDGQAQADRLRIEAIASELSAGLARMGDSLEGAVRERDLRLAMFAEALGDDLEVAQGQLAKQSARLVALSTAASGSEVAIAALRRDLRLLRVIVSILVGLVGIVLALHLLE